MLSLIVYLILAGLGLYVVGLLPIDDTLKKIIRAVVIVAVCIMLLYFVFALLPSAGWPRLK